jgi:hypothetical protein
MNCRNFFYGYINKTSYNAPHKLGEGHKLLELFIQEKLDEANSASQSEEVDRPRKDN